ERLRAQIDAATEVISFIVQGKLVAVNDRASEILGYTPDELVGMTPLDFVAPESHEMAIAHIRAQYDKPYEIVALRKDGSRFPAEVCARTVPYRGGHARVVVMRDVGERKAAEAALRKAAVQQESLRTQAETLEALATPILPIHRDVVVV